MLNRKIKLTAMSLPIIFATVFVAGFLVNVYGQDDSNKVSSRSGFEMNGDVKNIKFIRIRNECQNFLNGRFWKEGVKSVVFENGEAKVLFDDGTFQIVKSRILGKMKSKRVK